MVSQDQKQRKAPALLIEEKITTKAVKLINREEKKYLLEKIRS